MWLQRIVGRPLLVTLCIPCFAVASGCSADLRGREIRWISHGTELVGTLALPEGDGPHPVAVFVAGSGCFRRPRAHAMIRQHARQLTAVGIGLFAFDKRGCGKSGGDWREVGLVELADDVLSVLPQLSADPRVDAERLGLIGLSQGGWVSLLAAKGEPGIGFIVMLSGPPMSPAEQGHAVVELALTAKGWDEPVIERALELDRRVIEVYRSDRGWDEARAAIEEVSTEPWFTDANIGVQPRDTWNWKWLRTFMDYDPLPELRELEIPILAIFGENDLIVPAARSKRILDEVASSAKGSRATVVIDGVGHQLRRDRRSDWPDSYWSTLLPWLESTVSLEARH